MTQTMIQAMLAHKDDEDKADYPAFIQPKLDGVRCLFSAKGAFSRTGNQFMNVMHIEKALEPFFAKHPNMVIDGELYNHGLKDDFEKIISLVRKTKPTFEDRKEAEKLVQYHIYDIVPFKIYFRYTDGVTYEERLDLEPINYNLDNTDLDGNIYVTYGDEFYDTGFAPEWYDIISDNYRLDADWTYRTQTRHKIKAGIENTLTRIQVLDIDEPWTGSTGFGANYDAYKANTMFGALYFQDRITFEGMTVNLGMRYDYWIPGKYVEHAINDLNTVIITDAAREKFQDETFSLLGYRAKGRFSPRFGISHPVTDNDVLYFYYGHFSQLPTFQYVYAKLQSTSQSTYQVFGNPNLNPKTTVQYELGIKHRFSEDQVLEMKAYWKDMFDYETSQTISPSNPKYAHLRFNMYFNADYARARGIELIIKSRVLQNWFADVNFNYSIVTGKSSTPLDNLLVQAGELREKPLGENYMSWDRPFQFFTNLYYSCLLYTSPSPRDS